MFYITKLNVFYLFCFFIICNKSIGQSRFDSIIKHSKRASTHKLKLEFSDTLGNKTFLPILIVKGKQKGKTFTILAGVHGAEYAPIIASQELIKELKPNELIGTVIILPITNIGSFYTKTPYINPLDNKNINRIFPGKKEGTVSERIVNFISSEVIPKSDIFLDVHGGDASETYFLLCVIMIIKDFLDKLKLHENFVNIADSRMLCHILTLSKRTNQLNMLSNRHAKLGKLHLVLKVENLDIYSLKQ